MKFCKKCATTKNKSDFYNDSFSKDHMSHFCKKCDYSRKTENNRSKKGVATIIYNSQRSNSRKRGHSLPTYSKQELKEWLYSQPVFHKLYDNWKRLDYQKDYRPSVDRKKDNIGYTIDNIQLMTWGKNNRKAAKGMKDGCLDNGYRSVCQYTINNIFVEKFTSIAIAARLTGACRRSISQCCKEKYKSSGGFIWRYTDVQDI